MLDLLLAIGSSAAVSAMLRIGEALGEAALYPGFSAFHVTR